MTLAPETPPTARTKNAPGVTPVTTSLKATANWTPAALVGLGPSRVIDWMVGKVLSTSRAVASNGWFTSGLPAGSVTPFGVARTSRMVPSPSPVMTVTV